MNQQFREYPTQADVQALDLPPVGPEERAQLVGRIAELRVQLMQARAEAEQMRQERDQFYQLAMLQGVLV